MAALLCRIVPVLAFLAMSAGAFAGQNCPAEVILKAPQGELRADRAVTFSVTVRNPGGSPLNCLLPTAQVYEVLVLREGRMVWRWSQGMRFAAVLTPLSLPPEGARAYRADWETSQGALRNLAGEPLEPGSYQAVAVLKVRPEIRSQPVSLHFPPPANR
jgi:hypothetical protein